MWWSSDQFLKKSPRISQRESDSNELIAMNDGFWNMLLCVVIMLSFLSLTVAFVVTKRAAHVQSETRKQELKKNECRTARERKPPASSLIKLRGLGIFILFAIAITAFAFMKASTRDLTENESKRNYPEETFLKHMSGNMQCDRPKNLLRPAIYSNETATFNFEVRTVSKSAQDLCNQGIILCFGFNMYECNANFKQAVKEDENCAMCWWGLAYSNSPNINTLMSKEQHNEARNSILRGIQVCKDLKECDYLHAIAKRFAPHEVLNDAWNKSDTNQKMIPFDVQYEFEQDYSKELQSLTVKYPKDTTLKTLFVESLMGLSPWRYYNDNHTSLEPHADLARQVLVQVLKEAPNHPYALHLWIHLVEPSEQRKWSGIDEARRILKVAPSSGHLIHMASHIFLRTGSYEEAIAANKIAFRVNQHFMKNCVRPYATLHNRGLLADAAILSAKYKDSIQYSLPSAMLKTMWILPTVFYPRPDVLVYTRYGNWQALLNLRDTTVGNEPPYVRAIWSYAKALAHLHTNEVSAAKKEAERITHACENIPTELPADIVKGTELELLFVRSSPFYPAHKETCLIAKHTVLAALARVSGEVQSMIDNMKIAFGIEQGLYTQYLEPPLWYLPIRECLGTIYLAMGNYYEASYYFREDLVVHPNSAWSVRGLVIALNNSNNETLISTIREYYDEKKVGQVESPCMELFFRP